MTVNKKTGEVFDAILNVPPKIMPNAKKNSDGWWSFTASKGPAKLKFKENKQLGVLDHVFVDQEAKWDIPMRVVPSGKTSEVIVTLVKPKILTDKQFDDRMTEVEAIMTSMKEILEKD